MTPGRASMCKLAPRGLSRAFRAGAAAWAWDFRSRAGARCSREAILCWCRASSEERRFVSCCRLRSILFVMLPPLLAQEPIARVPVRLVIAPTSVTDERGSDYQADGDASDRLLGDRKSTRLNSSHT